MKSNIFFIIILFILIASVSIYMLIKEYLIDSIPDKQLLNYAEELDEVKTFLNRYPNAYTIIDRSGSLAIDYRVDSNNEYIRLRVTIDPLTNRVDDIFVECYNNKSEVVRDNIINYINTKECIRKE
ncbi:MAG: hypothetical protein KatS3mg003_2384 [Candidatus Nitrosocaldaceae archaeon]|nr:MAG: hypothetical protein KatS3mg003_2384 [Candidatus Nitrosocaldaceae archaeon]